MVHFQMIALFNTGTSPVGMQHLWLTHWHALTSTGRPGYTS